VYIELSPQQLPLLDIMRLLRQRRKTEPGAQAFVTDQLKAASAVLTQVCSEYDREASLVP
jgi:hypothetical protein